jgi:hypothetical protein
MRVSLGRGIDELGEEFVTVSPEAGKLFVVVWGVGRLECEGFVGRGGGLRRWRFMSRGKREMGVDMLD